MDIVFITDTHFRISSNVREGDSLQDLADKLKFVVDYCNLNDAILLHGGDVFDSPSVPDMVKNKIAPIFKKLKKDCFALSGNHCQLYNNPEYNYKTSFQTFVATGVLKSLDGVTVDLGELIITNELPVIQRNKPQIVVYHGFLNQEDGKNTFHFQDIAPGVTDQVYILLGHDHCVYDPLPYLDSIKFFRPGSFNRQTREQESMRIPQLMHIRCSNGQLKYKMVPIASARPAEEVFKTKLLTVTKAQQRNSYDDIIAQIRSANSGDLTFEQAMHQVAPDDVCNFVTKILTESRLNRQHNRANL